MTPVFVTICPACHRELPQGARFCPVCGARLEAVPAGDPLLGTVVGERYRLTERLGSGRTGMIYRAEHITLHRKAAVKLLHPALTTDPAGMDRFSREARVVSEMENEHLVNVTDFGRTGAGQLYLAMELLEGETLAEHLRRHARLPVERTVDILSQVADGLMEAHAMGYVHRDLRPSNLFLVKRRGHDLIKILGFGVAKMVGGDTASVSGISVADPTYMSPEQARGDTVDGRSDIYSLAVIGYEMLIGAPPFSGPDISRIVRQHLEAPPAPPSRLRPEIPPSVERALLQALSKRPDERFATMLRFVEALGGGTGAAGPQVRAPLSSPMVFQPPPQPATPAPIPEPAAPLPKVMVAPAAAVASIDHAPSWSAPVAAATPVPAVPESRPAPPAAMPRRPLDARMPTPGFGTMQAPTQSGVWFARGDEMDRQAAEESAAESTLPMTATFVRRRGWILYVGVAVTSLLVTLVVGSVAHRCSGPETDGNPAASTRH